MSARLSVAPAAAAQLMRRVLHPALATVSATAQAAASSTASPCVVGTTARAFHGPNGALRTSAHCCAAATRRSNNSKKKTTATTAKARTPRRRASAAGAAAAPPPPQLSSPVPLEDATAAPHSTGGRTTDEEANVVATPPLDTAIKEQRRVLQLRDAVREWSALRQRCRWQRQHTLSASASSRASGTVGASAAAAAATTSESSSLASAPALPSRATSPSLHGSRPLETGSSSSNNSANAEVHMEERAVLMSTVAKEAKTYPQLSALFYPHGHSSATRSTVVDDTPPGAAAAAAPLERAVWEVSDVSSLMGAEADTVALLTLLRVHFHVAQQSEEGARLHNVLWDAFVRGLQQRISREATAATARTAVAQVLHVLVAVYRDQLALGVTTVGPLHDSTKAKKGNPNAKRKTNLRKVMQQRKQTEEAAAVHARVARVLEALVSPLYELDQLISAESGSAAASVSTNDVSREAEYGAASTLVMLAALSAVAEEAAALLSRSSSPQDAPHMHSFLNSTRPKWRKWRDASLSRLFTHFEDQRTKGEESAAAAAGSFVDVLRCLRWTEELEVVLRVSTLGKVEALCQRALLQTCRTAAAAAANNSNSSSGHLFEYLCTPSVAAELNRLSPDRVTYAQAFTDLCTVAAAYLQQRPDRISSLVNTQESEHHTAAARIGLNRQLPPRPPLRCPVVQLLYAMLCSGFAAASLLTSELCLSLSPRDTADVVRAADLFSLSCGTAPLPVRTRGVLVDQVVGLLTQCRKDGHRVVVSSTDAADGDGGSNASLAARRRDGAAASSGGAPGAGGAFSSGAVPSSTSAARRSGRGRGRGSRSSSTTSNSWNAQISGASDENAVAAAAMTSSPSHMPSAATVAAGSVLTPAVYRTHVNYALYVSVEAIVECVVRGDVSAVEAIAHALLPLLQQEGREAALTEGLECIWATLRDRLTELGSNDLATAASYPAATAKTAGVTSPSHQQTTPAMEEALALLSTLFLAHMTESAMRMLTGASLASASAAANTGLRDGAFAGGGGARVAPLDHRTAAPLRSQTLIDMALRLTTVAVLCGVPAGTVAQLTTLHNTLLKSQGRAAEMAASYGKTAADASGGSASSVAAPVGEAFAVVERLERLLTDLTRQALPWTRHPSSTHVRSSGAAVQQVLGVYIASTAAVVRGVTQSVTAANIETGDHGASPPHVNVSAPYRHYLLTVVHLLYRLSTEFPVETEPATLRQFRIDVLDPALTAALLAAPTTAAAGKKKNRRSATSDDERSRGTPEPVLQMPLTTLTEVIVVMCVPESVQHVSSSLMCGVVTAVEQHLKARKQRQQEQLQEHAAGTDSPHVVDTVSGVLAMQLLSSAAAVCLRADDTLTAMLLQLLDQLSPLLSLWQATTVLERLHATGAPLFAPAVRVLIERLVTALHDNTDGSATPPSQLPSHDKEKPTKKERISAGQQIRMLHSLSGLQRTADVAVAEQRWSPGEDVDVAALLRLLHAVPYAPLLRSLVQPSLLQHHPYSVGECGCMVEVVAHLLQRMDVEEAEAEENDTSTPLRRWTADERDALRLIPRTLAMQVLQAVQLSFPRQDVPLLLRGYAALTSEPHLQRQMLGAFISRTIRAAPVMTPVEIVECVEAYCVGGVFHEQLYGVLLGRAADMGRRLTLELSVRLLRCGTLAGHASVRTVCVTAVQPIFSSQVRGLLQSDPRMLVSLASTALAILHCLRDCFPHDDIGAAVLTNVARYHHDASLSVVKAALELIEKRGSVDYDVTHVLARHCTEAVLPTCTAAELANVTCLLLVCGLRSSALLEVVYRRLGDVVAAMSGGSLAKLAQGLLRASVEVDTAAVQLMCERVVVLTTASTHPTGAAEGVGNEGGEEAPLKTSDRCRSLKTKGRTSRSPPRAAEDNGGGNSMEGTSRSTTPPPAATASASAASPAPLTLHHVCAFLRLSRSVGRRLTVTAMETVDVLLRYTQNRIAADVAAMSAAAQATTHSTDAADLDETRSLEDDKTAAAAAPPPLPPPLPVLEGVHPQEVEEVLRACIDLSSTPKVFFPLVRSLADYMAFLLQQAAAEDESAERPAVLATTVARNRAAKQRRTRGSMLTPSGVGATAAAALAWQSDLILLVDLCSLFVRLGEAGHPVVKTLFSVLYERRGTLLQRALLLKTTKQSLELAGRAVHPELYKLVVDEEIA
ncbi:hypothetical protein ABB37_09880 [Leptomonas pyrrhocoris]|uniref:Uncharacterized protein n=1 Tax=Leptomonas pyrrhocoris TaxID=157538 RepID=A0A0M9FPM4_LEPPY|nr:hypothetical protein ABB37_09880 [Leptomonas pyrrhocoris]KPA73437.1 hypothetical protein ABB37_09880 [Leptomonas pyrrhocoris]|eukprot:XP_015651876.1 hypothetical protein ABB37_09880 [Leptomonas pyrrhocoris]